MPSEALDVDPETGLPPDEETLERERQRLEALRAAAAHALQLLREAQAGSRLRCAAGLPQRALGHVETALGRLEALAGYRRCVTAVMAAVEAGELAPAVQQLQEFIDAQPQVPEGAWRLLKALRTGEEAQAVLRANLPALPRLGRLMHMDLAHPVLARLRQERQRLAEQVGGPLRRRYAEMLKAAEQLGGQGRGGEGPATPRAWLTAPLPHDARLGPLRAALEAAHEPHPAEPVHLNRAVNALLQAAGANRTALLAAAGDVEAVVADVRADPDAVPHNLGVAVLARLDQQSEPPAAEHLAPAVASAALFACCPAYRAAVAERLGWRLPAALEGRGHALQARVRAELELFFRHAGLSWGKPGDPASWACRWEVECLAVNRLMTGGSYAPLPWPFGPTLVEFYELTDKLQALFRSGTPVRLCYGPCAAGEALHWAGDAGSALRALPEVDACTPQMAADAPGYRALPDPLGALKADAAAVRCDVWLDLLRRKRFRPQTTPAEADRVTAGLIDACRELLALEERGADVAERFTRSLGQVFDDMEEQLARPEVYLARKATVADGEARKACMDGVIDYLRRAPARPWLAECLRLLQLRRGDLLLHLVGLKFDWWRAHNRQAHLLDEMVALAEQATRDAPNAAAAHVIRAQMMMLRISVEGGDEAERGALRQYLDRLQQSATGFHWPALAIGTINELRELLDGSGDFSAWVRRLALDGSTARGVTMEMK